MAVARDSGFPITGRDTTGSGGLAWPTFTIPGGSRLLVATALQNGAAARTISGMTSTGLTWARLPGASGIDSGNNWCNEVWWAWASAGATISDLASTDNSGASWSRRSMVVDCFSGSVNTGPGNAAVDTALTDTKPSIAVTGSGAGSLLCAGLAYRSAGSDIAPNASVTEHYDAGFGGGFGFNEVMGSRSGSGSLTLAWDAGDDVFNMGVMSGFEIVEAGGGGGGGTTYSGCDGTGCFHHDPKLFAAREFARQREAFLRRAVRETMRRAA